MPMHNNLHSTTNHVNHGHPVNGHGSNAHMGNGHGANGAATVSKRGRPKARSKWLQVRMSEEERNRLDQVAATYGMDASGFIRAVITFCETTQPDLPNGEQDVPEATIVQQQSVRSNMAAPHRPLEGQMAGHVDVQLARAEAAAIGS